MTDVAIARADQVHVFLRGDALANGFTDREVARLVRSGEWHRVRRGAYALGAAWAPLDEVQRHGVLARAAVRQAKAPVAASHISALPDYDAPVWGLPLDVVHLARLDGRAGRKERGIQQHRGRLEVGDVIDRRGLDVVSATKTAIDITTIAPVEKSLVVVNHLLHAGHTDV